MRIHLHTTTNNAQIHNVRKIFAYALISVTSGREKLSQSLFTVRANGTNTK